MSSDSVDQVAQSFHMYPFPLKSVGQLWSHCISLAVESWQPRKVYLLKTMWLCCFSSIQSSDDCSLFMCSGICMLCVISDIDDLSYVLQVSICCMGEASCVSSSNKSATHCCVPTTVCSLISLIGSLHIFLPPAVEGCWLILVSQWITTF